MIIEIKEINHKDPISQDLENFIENNHNSFIQHSICWSKSTTCSSKEKLIVFKLKEKNKILGLIIFNLLFDDNIKVMTSISGPASIGGPIISDGNNNQNKILNLLLNSVIKFCKKESVEVCTIVTNPLSANINEIMTSFNPELIFRNFTQIANLKNFEIKNNITVINNLEKKLSFHENHVNENSFNEFYEFYKTTYLKKNYKIFEKEYLKKICFEMHNNCRFFFVKKNYEIKGTLLSFFNKNIAEYFLAACSNDIRCTNEFLVKKITNIFKEKNVKYLNFQSSTNFNDGVFNFKKKFNTELKYYFFLSKIFIKKDELIKKNVFYKNISNRFIIPYAFNYYHNYNMSYIK